MRYTLGYIDATSCATEAEARAHFAPEFQVTDISDDGDWFDVELSHKFNADTPEQAREYVKSFISKYHRAIDVFSVTSEGRDSFTEEDL